MVGTTSRFGRAGWANQFLEGRGVLDGMAFHVVVEVDEDVAARPLPVENALGPGLESAPAVSDAAPGQVHPDIGEVAGDLEPLGHLRMVGNAERDPMPLQEFTDIGYQPRVVPELERIAQCGRKHLHESFQPLQIAVKVRLELKEDRTQLLAQPERRLDDKVDRFLFDDQPLDMADVPASLDGEEKTRRRLGAPGLESVDGRLAVERVIQLDGVEVAGIEGEVLPSGHLLGIEAASPVRI